MPSREQWAPQLLQDSLVVITAYAHILVRPRIPQNSLVRLLGLSKPHPHLQLTLIGH